MLRWIALMCIVQASTCLISRAMGERSSGRIHHRLIPIPRDLRRCAVFGGVPGMTLGGQTSNSGADVESARKEKPKEAQDGALKSWKPQLPEELSIPQSRLLLLAIAAAYGTNYAAVKSLSDALDPSLASLLRFGLSSIVFFPYVVKYRATPSLAKSAVEIGALNFCGYFGQALALNEGLSASAVAFICSLAVVVVPALDAVFPQEDMGAEGRQNSSSSSSKILAFVPSIISALGVGYLTGFGSEVDTTAASTGAGGGGTTGSVFGYMAAFLQPLLFGWAYWRQPQLIRKTCSEPGHYLAFTGTSLLAVSVLTAVWAASEGVDPDSFQLFAQASRGPNSALFAILWTGLATTAGTTLLENIAMKQLTGTESTVIYSTEPLFATFFGFVLLGEALGQSTIIGGSLIISAILLSVKLEERGQGQDEGG